MPPTFSSGLSGLVESANSFSPYSMLKAFTAVLAASTTFTAHEAVPDFEVKLSLTNKSLTAGTPNHDLRETFKLQRGWEDRSYAYYDTADKNLNEEGWAVRLRHKEHKGFEYVYKKRYPVTDGLDAALARAKEEGFDSSDENYAAQMDWSYGKQTLSFSTKKKTGNKKFPGSEMPPEEAGREWLIDMIPGKLENWRSDGWGVETLGNSRQYGPVTATMWDGTWSGVDISVEVLPLIQDSNFHGHDFFVEMSFKVDKLRDAEKLRDKLMKKLDKAGWLVHNDILKTQMILSRY